MKTYKLLKDLPRAKAGEVVIITNAHSNNPWILKINKWNEDEKQRPRLAYIHTKNVDEWLEEIPEKQKTIWNLKKWDNFWVISTYGDISEHTINDDEFFIFNFLMHWNVFLTQEEAKKELNKRNATQRIKNYCYKNNIKLFSDEEVNEALKNNTSDNYSKTIYLYYIFYIKRDNEFGYSCLNETRNQECFYFEKEKDIKKVIVNCEKDLKIIFDV